MKIIHVVTLLSDKGAYGGPLRVALNQVGELRARGHDVELIAGWSGQGPPPALVDGVRIRTFPVVQRIPLVGFSGLTSRPMSDWLRQSLPDCDVLHVHAGRDLISLDALRQVRRTGTRVVIQSHGMITPGKRFRVLVFDYLLRGTYFLGKADAYLALTDTEAANLRRVASEHSKIVRIRNGVPDRSLRSAPLLATAEVLFCARLHARKRPLEFLRMAKIVLASRPETHFSIVGPDGGNLAEVEQEILDSSLSADVKYEGALPYEEVVDRVSGASIYVLPSFDEPFPMSLLEALSVGVPCVCTDQTGVSKSLQSAEAAVVTDGSAQAMADAVLDLLSDETALAQLGVRGWETVRKEFSISAVVNSLEEIYVGLV